MADVLVKGSRITGAERAALGASLAERYQAGESIRALAEDIGRSFGFVHGVITEAGVALRGRGGATRGVPSATAEAAPTATSDRPEALPEEAAPQKPADKKLAGKKPGGKKSEGKKLESDKTRNGGKKSQP